MNNVHLLGCLSGFILIFLIFSSIGSSESKSSNSNLLYIAIVSAGHYSERRMSLRETWLSWLEGVSGVDYGFEIAVCDNTEASVKESVFKEKETFHDINFVDNLPASSYASFQSFGEKNSYQFCGNEFLQRSQIIINYGKKHNYTHTYFLMIDDDGFLCLPSLLSDLRDLPYRYYFSGKYYCKFEEDNRADSNYMLFTTNLIQLFVWDWTHEQVIDFGEPKRAGGRRFFGREMSNAITVSKAVLFDDPRIKWSTEKLDFPLERLCLEGNIWFHKTNVSLTQTIFNLSQQTLLNPQPISNFRDKMNKPCGGKQIISLIPNSNVKVIRGTEINKAREPVPPKKQLTSSHLHPKGVN